MKNTENQQFIKAVKYIYQHIDEPITQNVLAKELNISVATLKRLFDDMLSESPGVFIRRLKMELAFQSLQHDNSSILEIALAAGFDNQSAFARTFKRLFGYSPKQARNTMSIVNELASIELKEPDIVFLQDIQLQSVTETGLYFESAPNAWKKIRGLLLEDELTDNFTGLFIGIGHDNPHEINVAKEKCRFSACVAYNERDIGADIFNIKGGYYARFNYKGKPNNLGLAYHYIYGHWVENSEYKIDAEKVSFNCFERFPESNSDEASIIHVPIVKFNT